MPHVRATEYKQPDTQSFQLKYVEVIHRHHKRTPYQANTFPREDRGWDCSDTHPFVFMNGNTQQIQQPVKGFWKTTEDSLNPFRATGYLPTSCMFPEITKEGLQDSFIHGTDLHSVYGAAGVYKSFLPATPDASTVFRVTGNMITSQVAGALISGLFPSAQNKDIPLVQQPATIESLEPALSCPAAGNLKNSYASASSGNAWSQHLTETQSLFAQLDALSGVDPNAGDWHVSWDHYFDSSTSRLCHNIPLACNLADTSDCIDMNTADEILRLGQWEYSFMYRDEPQSLQYSALQYGAWFNELLGHLESASTSNVKYRHNVAHDGSMSLVLSVLQVDQMFWPGMGAEVVFEVFEDRKTGGDRIRVLLGGQVLQSSFFGAMDMLPLNNVTIYLRDLVGDGGEAVVAGCNG